MISQTKIPKNKTPPCDKKVYKISSTDLPLSCPMPNMRLWDAHPRVYLPIEKTGKATCPYCETEYILSI